jgi:hypothetical protein
MVSDIPAGSAPAQMKFRFLISRSLRLVTRKKRAKAQKQVASLIGALLEVA